MATVETPEVEFRAEARYVRTAPRKAQAVVAEIRGLPVGQARTLLRFMTRAAARDVAKVLDSAVANAESHPTNSYDAESLFVSAAVVGSGPTLKRWRARARGRVGRIRKRTCHIAVRVAPIPGATAVRPAAPPEEPRRGRRAKAETAPPAATPAAGGEALEAAEALEAGAGAAEVSEPPAEAAAEESEAKPGRARKAATSPPRPPEEASAESPKRTRAAARPEAESVGEAPKPRRARAAKAAEPAPTDEPVPTDEPASPPETPKPRRVRRKAEDTGPEREE